MSSVEDIVVRMKESCGVGTDSELAVLLGLSSSSVISMWKSRNRKPFNECEKISLSTGVSMDWLLTGEGPMRRENAGPAQSELPREVQLLLEMVMRMDVERRREVLRRAEDQQRDAERAAKEREEWMSILQEQLSLVQSGKRSG